MRSLTIKIAIASGATILGLVHISQRWNIRQYTDAFFQGSQVSEKETILTPRQQKMIGVQYALRENNIIQAIHNMPTETAKDFYNIATLKTALAYQLMEQDDQNYKTVLEEAKKYFQSASSKTTNIYLKNRIKNNAMLSQNIEHIADIQTCFTDLDTILNDLNAIQTNIAKTQTAIQDQLQYIQENKADINQAVGEECQQKIQNTLSTSYDTLIQTDQALGQYTQIYTHMFNQYIDNPEYCLQIDFKPIIQDTQTTQKEIQEAQQTYSMTAIALQTKNTDVLQQMCEQTQNDTLSNQDLGQSVGKLLENLEQHTQSPEPSIQEPSNEESTQQDNNKSGPETAQPKYIPLTQEEKTLLEQAEQTNNQRIQTMMQIKKNNYNPSQILQTIFEIFYGDTNEFTIPGR